MKTIPEQCEQIPDERKAVAPYNFVPLSEKVRYIADPPSHGFYASDLLCGTISCTLINETPIYVRSAQTKDAFEKGHVASDPFHYGDPHKKLIIPASSLRGMLRTLVEVVSYARISPVSDKQLFYRSVENTSMGAAYRDRMKDKVRAGFYYKDQSGSWIEPTIAGRVLRNDIRAQFGINDIYEEFDENHRPIKRSSPKRVPKKALQHKTVYIRLHELARDNPYRFYIVDKFSRKALEDTEEAVLVITGDMQSRRGTSEKKEFAFLKIRSRDKIRLDDEQIELFEHKDQITQYQEHAFPKEEGRPGNGKLKSGDPVFYLVGDNERKIEGFGRAYMFRLPYSQSPSELLPDDYDPDKTAYDLAEAVFGFVPQDNQSRKQVAGRVFISDAQLRGDAKAAYDDSELTLRVLSSPKPTTFQHYLTQEQPFNPDDLSHYDDPARKTVLRGHKFYWHKGPVARKDYVADPEHLQKYRTQYSPPIKPIRENRNFDFQIKFENLRPEELGAILWVMDKAKDEKYRLKLGMGKPYGLGSVAIQWKIQLEDRAKRYEALLSEKNDQWAIIPAADQVGKLENARSEFARWLFKKPDATHEQIDHIPRIQNLLILLSWKDRPEAKKTRYMELDEFAGRKSILTGEEGYFPKRPVLPSPHAVLGQWLNQPVILPQERLIAPPVKEKMSIKSLPEKKPVIARSQPSDLHPGDIIEAIVCDAPQKGDILLHCEFHDEDDFCIISEKSRNEIDRFRVNKKVILRVVRVLKETNGWLIECEKFL